MSPSAEEAPGGKAAHRWCGNSDRGPGRPQPQWESRWGAVAVTNGAFGYSHSWPTERQAISKALAACSRDAGGATCTLKQSYHDQCIVLA
ncbi:DUF4189 domain-containing protein [Methylocystis parvus]|uniref:DUF4189 domain-containing protein n=1 Tax=Methylocystis parvus TaxID=134 RepID=UPI003CC6389F